MIPIGKYSIPVALRHGHSYFLKLVMNDDSFALIGLQSDDSVAFIIYNLFFSCHYLNILIYNNNNNNNNNHFIQS